MSEPFVDLISIHSHTLHNSQDETLQSNSDKYAHAQVMSQVVIQEMYPRKYFAFSSAIFVSPACGLFNLCGDEYFLKRELTLSSTPDSLVGDKSDV